METFLDQIRQEIKQGQVMAESRQLDFQKKVTDSLASSIPSDRLDILRQSLDMDPADCVLPGDQASDKTSAGEGEHTSVKTSASLGKSKAISRSESPSVTEDRPNADEEMSQATDAKAHAERRGLVKITLSQLSSGSFHFEGASESSVSIAQQEQIGIPAKQPSELVMPVQKAMRDTLKNTAHFHANADKNKKAKLDKILRRMYQVPYDQSSHWEQFPHVPPEFDPLIFPKFRYRDTKRNMSVLNSKELPKAAEKEQRSLLEFNRAQMMLKVSNINSMATYATVLRCESAETRLKVLTSQIFLPPEERTVSEEELQQYALMIRQDIQSAHASASEARVNAADLIKLHSEMFVSSVRERRDLWVDNARLSEERKQELKSNPVHIPALNDSDESRYYLFSQDDRRKFQAWLQDDISSGQLAQGRTNFERFVRSQTTYQTSKPNYKGNNNQSKGQNKGPQNQPNNKPFQKPQSDKPQSGNQGKQQGNRYKWYKKNKNQKQNNSK
jgi:hypothetical protein